MKVLVGNIQRFCFHDGPGIRTTVFSMGCILRCPWCCNPENLTHSIKQGKMHTYGKEIDSAELVSILLKDSDYYKDGGGVTFSGGEFLLNVDEYFDVLKSLKREGVDICVETSLVAPLQNLKKAIDYFDLFIVDFKILDKEKAKTVLNSDSSLFYDNFESLSQKKYWARIPLVDEIIEDNNLKSILSLFKKHKPERVELLKIHNLGKSKYEDLSFIYSFNNKTVSTEKIEKVMDALREYNPQLLDV